MYAIANLPQEFCSKFAAKFYGTNWIFKKNIAILVKVKRLTFWCLHNIHPALLARHRTIPYEFGQRAHSHRLKYSTCGRVLIETFGRLTYPAGFFAINLHHDTVTLAFQHITSLLRPLISTDVNGFVSVQFVAFFAREWTQKSDEHLLALALLCVSWTLAISVHAGICNSRH